MNKAAAASAVVIAVKSENLSFFICRSFQRHLGQS
jgi:hypothetical protein